MTDQIASIGFIGLGRMGYPMTRNLLRAGFAVRVYDVVPDRIQALVDAGAQAATSPADAAAGTDLIISMILDDAALETVTLADDGIFAGARQGAIYADMSTVSPMASRKVAAARGRGRDALSAS